MKNKIKKIKVFACDIDGILTDGKIIFNDHGVQTKNFNVLDGFGLILLKQLNFKTAIITARGARVVRLRAKDLGINKVYLDSHNKIREYEKMLRHFRRTRHRKDIYDCENPCTSYRASQEREASDFSVRPYRKSGRKTQGID